MDDERSYDDELIKPEFCPRCCEKVLFINDDDTIECPYCGKLYFDMWLGIWRVQKDEEKA